MYLLPGDVPLRRVQGLLDKINMCLAKANVYKVKEVDWLLQKVEKMLVNNLEQHNKWKLVTNNEVITKMNLLEVFNIKVG